MQRESDWQRKLMQDRQMRDNPGLAQAAAGGWELQPDGNYRRMINGVTQTMPAGMLAGNMQAQGMAQQVSNPATIGGNTDYVGQLKALLGERQQSHPEWRQLDRRIFAWQHPERCQFGAADKSLRTATARADEQSRYDCKHECISFQAKRGPTGDRAVSGSQGNVAQRQHTGGAGELRTRRSQSGIRKRG
ncbi:MAG: hypothetical protein IPK44_25305 [Candidatus Accumulibacter sp.]|uniref:hypothetical protein n=1 Tax=Accumulibacter sp. TaxID=2053492 RepID=UPI002590B314|nr:hypothetical protein [Accumulibacter sp.]MBK8117607.1 hypothetical protein [Accumulibacter sp.]